MKKLLFIIATVALLNGCQQRADNTGGTGAGSDTTAGSVRSRDKDMDTNGSSTRNADTNSNPATRNSPQ